MKNSNRLLFAVGLCLFIGRVHPAAAASFTVIQQNFQFNPNTISISPGDTITWTNIESFTPHTSTSGSPPGTPNGLWNGGTENPHTSFTFTFTSFAPGTYPFYCNFHYPPPNFMTGAVTVVSAALPPPTVSITNPLSGVSFAAPASITLMADANQSGGTVTNVQFFSGASSLGNIPAAPYNFNVNAAAGGNFSFTAVAVNNQGGSATSAVVNVFFLTNAILSSPLFTNSQFQLTINGIAGQTYITQSSSNLTSWSDVLTNLAPADIFQVVDPSALSRSNLFYRTRQGL
jgi:plastocyanin